jgi:hypothetical protein
VANGDKVKLVLEEITPERALDLITGNTDNRNIRQATVDAYARDMTHGMWRDGAGEPIHFDPDVGVLGNGQHRLLAVVESEVTVRMPVLYAPIDYRMVADQGIRRSFADVLRITHHVPNPNQLAAAVRYLWEYRRAGQFGTGGHTTIKLPDGTVEFVGKPTVAELEAVFLAEKGLVDHLVWIGRLRDAGVAVFPSLYVALDYLFHEVDYDDGEAFSTALWQGDNLPADSSILALRRVMANPSRPNRARAQAALTIKAWNAWRQGEGVQLLAWRAGGSHPEAFPKIDGMPDSRFNRRRRRGH